MTVGGSVNVEHELWKVYKEAAKVRIANEPTYALSMVSAEAVEGVAKSRNIKDVANQNLLAI